MTRRNRPWGVWCVVSGGATGRREAWLRTDGERVAFATREQADEEARRLQTEANASPYNNATFVYTAAQFKPWRRSEEEGESE